MQLSVLQSQTRFLTNTDTDSYTNDEINSNLTRWAHLLTTEILDSQDEWDFQGEIATGDLVAGQREYLFPTDILKIKRIDLKLDGTNWILTTKLDESEIPTSISSETDITNNFDNSKPCVAFLDESFFIYSGTIIAVTGGFKIWYSEEIVGKNTNGVDIASFSASTDTPNIREAFQRGLIYGAAKDWASKYELWNKARIYDAELEKIILRMKQFYGSRIQDRRIFVKTAADLENYE